MVKFDTKLFFKVAGQGESPIRSIGMAFGMPSCLLNLTDDLLSLLPTDILQSIKGSAMEALGSAKDGVTSSLADIRYSLGMSEIQSKNGIIKFISNFSRFGLEILKGKSFDNLKGFDGALSIINDLGTIYNNIRGIGSSVRGIKNCIKSYVDYLKFSEGASDTRESLSEAQYNELVEESFGARKIEIEKNLDFIDKVSSLITNIDKKLNERYNDPSKEPVFSAEVAGILSGTDLLYVSPDPTPGTTETGITAIELIRLANKAPSSKIGRFLTSQDGLLFDSTDGGVGYVLHDLYLKKSKIDEPTRWKLEFDPNLGGRGVPVDAKNLKEYFNTIYDLDIIDNSVSLKQYYDVDVLLTDIIGHRNRRIYDLNNEVKELVSSNAASIIINNLRQVLISESAHFDKKINKRKKQIELAVKLPVIHNLGSLFTPGNIPINDFSYLNGVNLNLTREVQRELVINQSEVSSVVLPIDTYFVDEIEVKENVILDHLLLTYQADGSIISLASGVSSVSGAELTVNGHVVTDNLIALYNNLSFDFSNPESTTFGLFNSNDTGVEYNAQIVGNPEEVFVSGVGIPYLGGITKHSSVTPTFPSGLGSYIKLPEKNEFQNFLFNTNGGTFECWAYLPDLDSNGGYNSNGASGLFRLLLANENVGVPEFEYPFSSIHEVKNINSPGISKGLVIGFTRDRRFTYELSATNNQADNPAADSCFIIAPTQAYDNSSIAFIHYKNKPCDTGVVYHGLTVPITTSVESKSFSSCGSEFCHIVSVFDNPRKLVKVYLDGTLMKSLSYEKVFGRDYISDIPSLNTASSFEYNATTLPNSGKLKDGPGLDTYVTPWILGGGYTDGMQTGNFMGGAFGGQISGLKGFIGSIKFYSKALTDSEVLNNYTVNSNFFKFIRTD